MGPGAAPLIGAGLSAGASLLGSGKAARQQSQAEQAASGYYNAETQAIQQLLGNYFKYAPTLENDLLNFSSKQQPEIQQLANILGMGDQSMIRGLREQVSGGANPAAVLGGLSRDFMQNRQLTTQNMESQLVGQQLQAYGDLGNLISEPVAGALGGLNSMGNSMASAASGFGNPWQSGIASAGNFLGMLMNRGGSSGSNYSPPPIDWSVIPTQPDYSVNTNPYSQFSRGPQP